MLLRERLRAGDSDQQAIQYIVARYGQFVLLHPPVEPATYALWFGPPALLAARRRRRRASICAAARRRATRRRRSARPSARASRRLLREGEG